MFTQFFGNYLINEGIITNEQLLEALAKKKETRVKIGTLAINKGYMTVKQFEKLYELQKGNDKKIGDLAVEHGYLTSEQLIELLSSQSPDYLALSQALLDIEAIDKAQFEKIINEYKMKFEILEKEEGKVEKLAKLLELFYDIYNFSGLEDEIMAQYFILLINNFIRFIGDDFVFISMTRENIDMQKVAFYQGIKEKIKIGTILNLDENSAIGFASRFIREDFTQVNEYVEACIYDFLNIHNGLFVVNLSNQYGIELTLTPPEKKKDFKENDVIVIKLQYPFGELDFIVSK